MSDHTPTPPRRLSPAASRLLTQAKEVLAMAEGFRAGGRDGDAIACALFAAEYARAARALQEMHDACPR